MLAQRLLAIKNVVEVEFDKFASECNQTIFLIKYKFTEQGADYWKARSQLKMDVYKVATELGLKWSGDTVEDYGEHFYFVFDGVIE